jgi:hypothetical protein
MAWESLGSKAQCLYSAVTEISRLGDARRTAVIRRHDRFSDRRYVCRHGGWVLGATIAWSRELFDRFGPLDPSLHGEDWAIPFRASLADGVVLVDEPLVRYRIGTSTWRSPLIDGSSHSETKVRQAANIRLGSARQALRDVMRLGDTSLESLVRQREQEAAALVELCYGKSLSLRSLLRACKSGVRLRQIAALELDRRLPRPLAMLHALRAKLRAAI